MKLDEYLDINNTPVMACQEGDRVKLVNMSKHDDERRYMDEVTGTIESIEGDMCKVVFDMPYNDNSGNVTHDIMVGGECLEKIGEKDEI